VWDATTFTKKRDQLLEAEVSKRFLVVVVEQARARNLTSDELLVPSIEIPRIAG
jgi:hypothetical protein